MHKMSLFLILATLACNRDRLDGAAGAQGAPGAAEQRGAPGTSGVGDIAVADKSASGSTLDAVLAQRKVTVGAGYTVPPMNYVDEQGEWTGFDLDLARLLIQRIAERNKSELAVEFVKVDAKTRVLFLASGRVHMTVSSMSQTRSRDDTIDYAVPPYLWVGKQFYAKKGRFKSITDLVGKKVAVQQGSNAFTAGAECLKAHGDPNPAMVAFQTDADAALALKQEKVDAFTQDNVILLGLMGESKETFEPVGHIYSPGLYGVGVRENDSNWRDELSFGLQDVLDDGRYEKVYLKWFGPDGKFPLATNARPRLPEDAYGAGKHFSFPN